MRVVHLITRLIIGGAQENTLATVLGLRGRPGLDLHLVSGPTTGPEGSLEPLARSVPGLFTCVPSLVRPVAPLRDPIALVALFRLLRARRPEIVHTHSGKAGILGRIAARAARVPIVIHSIHGPSFGAFQGTLANAAFTAAERIASRWTTHFVSVAHAMTRQYLAAGIGRADQFTRILSGFDLKPFLNTRNDLSLRAQLGLRPDDIVVGKIARLFKLKGHDDLLAIAADLVRELPRIRFLLVGDGVLRPRIEREIVRLGLGRHFVLTGLVPPEAIPGLIGLMDWVIHLSRREGLPRALPQAMAAARPVIAYDCDGAAEVCLEGRTGFLVQPGDLRALAGCIRKFALDPSLREQFGAAGQAIARELFPVERMVEEHHQLYLRLSGRLPSP
jgi:glycosyltransferase involved in cell wall biosynthesis